MGLGYLAQILIARLCGAHQFGIFAYTYSWLIVLSLFCNAGLDYALLRYVPSYISKQDNFQLQSLLSWAIQRVLLLSFAVTAIIVVLILLFRHSISDDLLYTLLAATPAIPISTLLLDVQALLRSLKRVALAILPDLWIKNILFILFLLSLQWILQSEMQGAAAMGLYLLASFAALLFGAIMVRRFLPSIRLSSASSDHRHSWHDVSLPLYFISCITLYMQKVDVILVGILLDFESAGIYAAAKMIANLSTFGQIAVNSTSAPVIAQSYADNQHDTLRHISRNAVKWSFLFTLPIILGLILSGRLFIEFYGPSFSSGYTAFLILTFGQFINVSLGPVGYLLTMTTHERPAARILFVSSCICTLANIPAILFWGINGAAVATAAAIVLSNSSMAIFVTRRMSINPTISSLLKSS